MTVAEARPRILAREVVTTLDGAELCTDVYLPDRTEARPAILVRTPYGRSVPLLMRIARQLARCGFCAVLQDCRGRYRSTGAYDLFHEVDDSHQTLRWLRDQEWCDGDVGLVGLSVSTLPNLLTAAAPQEGEARVFALVDVMGSVDYHRMCYRQGALLLHWTLPWTAMMGSPEGIPDWRGIDWSDIFRHRPLADAVRLTGAGDELWRFVVSHPRYEDLWQRLSAVDLLATLQVPVLHLSGWHDFMLDQTLLAWDRLGAAHRDSHRLIIGPWNHRSLFSETAPSVQATERLSLDRILAWWFDSCLGVEGEGEAPGGLGGKPPVLLKLMEGEDWIGADSFPLAEAALEDWFLASGGGTGEGRLVADRPPAPGFDGFEYDPADPVPTLGGAVWPFAPAGLDPGVEDQRPVEHRPDVRVYSGPPLARDLVVVGPVELDLWASTTARDTDFTGKLVDVDASGRAAWVQDGIVRGRFRNGREREDLLEAGRPYRFSISLGAVCHRFRAGHRIRLEVSSSNFPKFDRHPNSAAPPDTAAETMVARQTVFSGGSTASRLRLPVLPADAVEALRVDL